MSSLSRSFRVRAQLGEVCSIRFNGIRELCKIGEKKVQIGIMDVDREIPYTILGNGFLRAKKYVL